MKKIKILVGIVVFFSLIVSCSSVKTKIKVEVESDTPENVKNEMYYKEFKKENFKNKVCIFYYDNEKIDKKNKNKD